MRHDALLIPQAAVTELQGTFQAGVVGNDNRVAIRNLQMGSQVGSDWVVNQGLSPTDRVVVGGMQYARQGAVVHPELVPAASERR
jgi:membrane fusion protein (multidrug efflux system)